MDKKAEHEENFVWLADTLRTERQNSVRTIVYCQTIKQCSIIYAIIKGLLGNENMINDNGSPLVEMLHSCTPEANKNSILESFQQEHGAVRLLIATIAIGMGVDCKGVKTIIHYGSYKNLESYVQETGRAGRDGGESVAFLLYNYSNCYSLPAHSHKFLHICHSTCEAPLCSQHLHQNVSSE